MSSDDIKELAVVIAGSVLAFVTSLLRLTSAKKTFLVKLSDSFICALISLSTYYLINILHPVPPECSIAIGSWVGYLGADKIKNILINKIDKDV